MAAYDTRFDPDHYTARDGRILPVDGTHEMRREADGLVAYLPATEPGEDHGPRCGVCTLVPARSRADRFMVGQHVEWSYGKAGGVARGQVIATRRSRVQVMWQRVRKQPRPIWKKAIDLRVAVRT